MCLLPHKIQDVSFDQLDEVWTFYQKFLEQKNLIKANFLLWKNKCAKQQLPSNPQELLKFCDPEVFPNISKLLEILAVLPVTTCTCERTFFYLN